MSYHLGMDIGSVNAKLVLIDENSTTVRVDTERITSTAQAAVIILLNRLNRNFNLEHIITAGVSGSGRSIIPKELNWAEYSSSLSIIAGLLRHHPDSRTIIQIGGQSSLVIGLQDGLRKPWQVASNSLCAAGTGRFIEQQAHRLGIDMDSLAQLALRCDGNPPRIAARCSVFAKTDLIHLQQKGTPVETMLYALCDSISRMVIALKKGAFEEPVYFIGGVAANSAIVQSLNDVLSTRNGYKVKAIIPEDFLHTEALGSALLASESGITSQVTILPEANTAQRYFEMPRLQKPAVFDTRTSEKIKESGRCYLGVDVGSTSTKAVIINETGQILAKNYLMTAGRPVDAVKQVFRNLLKDYGDKSAIAAVGVTGSGRYLVGNFIGADLIKNEITAQTRAAAEIDPEADIIEIGGQDAKLIIKRNGVVIDYQMNKACAAGTGSFIDELAEMLGVSVNDGEFADLAFEAPHTIDLGTRCTAFMAQAIASAQQQGVPLNIITASLANSVTKNYLSKVVGSRKLGKKIILTGAVFHNLAVISAFHQQLDGKKLIVTEHREVSGAIGAALLAREAVGSKGSEFKGFQDVIDSECKLTTFTCEGCSNNCTITRMQSSDEAPMYYGSRCDRYDATLNHTAENTFFDEREELLFNEYSKISGKGLSVGIPRALLVYDYAPLLIGFLNALDVQVVLSGKTTKETTEQAIELSYTDSCFPLKLLYGHTAALKDVDYILYPSAIRLGKHDGVQNQKYACPLVQAAPFIIRQALDLGERMLIPLIDFSRGNTETVMSLADIAVRMGFSRAKGRQAALSGIRAQQRFEENQVALGKKLLQRLREMNQLGVVLFARPYMSQDSGANLGITEKLSQLGVVPIPLDFLPLASVNPSKYSDLPYWFSEAKHIAGAVITATEPDLHGLVLTNFGCGPNSFILKIVEDIMGNKPLGQLEIDEHAAEAGIVTRLEAFVDTIKGFTGTTNQNAIPSKVAYRRTARAINSRKTLLIPRMAPHAEVLGAAIEACGASAIVLPEPNEHNLLYSNQVTSGTECLPYRVTLGDFMRYCYDNGADTRDAEGFTGGAYGPCRFGKYATEQMRILKEIGFDLPIRTTVSNNAYRDWNLGPDFERLVWKGFVAIDCLEKLVWRTRPYEKRAGSADALFTEHMNMIAKQVRRKENFDDILYQATAEYRSLINPNLPRRPLVGINGEIFLRSNRFSNNNLVKACEDAGLEVIVSPIGEWFKYTSYRNVEDAFKNRKIRKIIISYIKKFIQEHDEHTIAANCRELLNGREPSTSDILALSNRYLATQCGTEAVLSIGSGIEWLENPEFAGVISVMPHACMPGGIVAAMSERLSSTYQKPWISLTYDGFAETNNLERISNFAEVIRFCNEENKAGRTRIPS